MMNLKKITTLAVAGTFAFGMAAATTSVEAAHQEEPPKIEQPAPELHSDKQDVWRTSVIWLDLPIASLSMQPSTNLSELHHASIDCNTWLPIRMKMCARNPHDTIRDVIFHNGFTTSLWSRSYSTEYETTNNKLF